MATGVVKTMFGRRRLVPEIVSRNGQVRAAAERMTVNMPIQGTAADILKLAMIDIDRELRSRNRNQPRPVARMILTVRSQYLTSSSAFLSRPTRAPSVRYSAGVASKRPSSSA